MVSVSTFSVIITGDFGLAEAARGTLRAAALNSEDVELYQTALNLRQQPKDITRTIL